VAKSTKHQDALGSFDNFRAPWQTETGEDAEIVPATLARLIYNLRLDKARLTDANEDVKAELTETQAALEEAKTQAADGSGAEAQKKIEKLEKDLAAAQAKVTEFETAAEQAELRREVLGDFDSQFPKAAKYVTGTTKEELEASLAAVREDFGITEGADGDEDGDEEETTTLRTRPRSTVLLNPADPNAGKGGEAEIDWEKWADEQHSARNTI
jgi:hypothetical protein